MLKNYFRIAWRNLAKNRLHSFINITGLAAGIAVGILIGLWIWDELSFDRYHQNYDHIAQVMENQTTDGNIKTQNGVPIPLGEELKMNYGSHFKYVVLSSRTRVHLLGTDDKQITKRGNFMEPSAPEMLSLKMLKGTRMGLKEPASIMISHSLSQSLFGDGDPVGKLITMDAKFSVKVTGVYEDLPYNTTFHGLGFIAPWELYLAQDDWPQSAKDKWNIQLYRLIRHGRLYGRTTHKGVGHKKSSGSVRIQSLEPFI